MRRRATQASDASGVAKVSGGSDAPKVQGAVEEAGGATVLVVAMAGVLMFVMVGLAAVGGLVTAQRRAQSAADLAALGGASAASDACGAAGRVAVAHRAALDDCRVDGAVVTVVVSVPGPDPPWSSRPVRVTAEARAGPG